MHNSESTYLFRSHNASFEAYASILQKILDLTRKKLNQGHVQFKKLELKQGLKIKSMGVSKFRPIA